ncbi:LD-carboxypeptidase [Novosphingobium sp.]|uniref:LD-carboxypeptidase n=1 Tax=Novosphingobium sp. TaxID=1874826 RepID=UPI00286A95B8|nr:LD-carboxypeptidase [Novosphingobium sp.]
MTRIAICAPSRSITAEDAARVTALAADYPGLELEFHPQCFLEHGHFAGTDQQRLEALIECANDPGFDAVWFARGGYGSNRIAEDAIARFDSAAEGKVFLGYSDGGYLLAGLYAHKIGRPVHCSMPADVRRDGGEAAVRRVLAFVAGDNAGLEPGLDHRPTVAFNLITLAMLCGTPLMPELAGHVVLVEEVSEHDYAVDRLFFHVTAHLGGIAGLRLGQVSDVPVNEVEFGQSAEEIARYWCARHAISYLGRADIGHDADNTIVPFGLARSFAG